MFLKSNRIYLREVRESDVNDAYYNWINDPEVNKYLESRYFPRSISNLKEYVKNLDGNPNEIFFAICLIENDKHIGNIKLGPINWIHRFADIGLMIGDKKEWGKGYASEAISLISDFSFNKLNLNKVKAGCYESNVGSANAFKKVGFSEEARLKKQWYVNNEFQDNIILGLLKEDYKK